ncbi:zinc finger protein 391-like [Scleropages formosus]|uniref:Zinc finger protein 391-like n=1 Tax=Scleropages formosus TaxID=113540 RepID=A0A8C9T930_SCLFO|nr:zinc finger protein 391-like [Scleropages formosus]XP_018600873.1 zinc finger protein 391-like [Scleropages formosus]
MNPYSEMSAVMDMCVKTEPDDHDISHPKNFTEGQGFSAEEVGSGLHLDTDKIKTEVVMVSIKEDSADEQLCSNTGVFCVASDDSSSSTCLSLIQCKSETGELTVQQNSQLQESSCMEKEINEAVHYGTKEEYADVLVHELNTCPLSEQYKSETDEVKLGDRFLENNSVKVQHSAVIAGGDILPSGALEQSVVPVTDSTTDKARSQPSHDEVAHKAHKCQCDPCKKVLENQSHLKIHLQIQSGDKYCCMKCGTNFSRSSFLKQHLRIFSGSKPHKCSECGKGFSQPSELKQHQLIHSAEKPYKCSECGKSYSQGSTLKQHQRVHSGAKPYKCSECGRSFFHGNTLKRHQLVHSGEKPYQCNECGRNFSRACTLKEHQRVHSGEKPYKCSDCGKCFSRGDYLKLHQRVHSHEKPHICSECGKSFSRGSTLKQHQLVHSGEKPYKCCECGKSFSRGGTLKQHQRVHSGVKSYPFSE